MNPLLQPVKRMTYGRKANLIYAVRLGRLQLADVLQAHAISEAEWKEWIRAQKAGGIAALRVTVRRFA